MQFIRTERQVGYKKHIGTWKLLQAVHQELLCNNSPSTGIVEEVTVKFSYYLLNQEFTLHTDHLSLRWLDSFHDKATDLLSRWLHFLEPFRPYMTILYRPGKLHSNADALSRIDTRPCPREDCPDHSHLIKKVKSPSEKKPRLLQAIQTRGQGGDNDLDTDLVPSLSNKEIRVSQKLDPELCRFMELLYKHAVKQEPPDVKILCSLWYELRVRDEILFRTGKEVTDECRLVIPRDKCKEILLLLQSSNTAGHPGMSRMKLTVCSRFYWIQFRNDIDNWINVVAHAQWPKEDPDDNRHHSSRK